MLELLSPAGSMESLRAAVQSGANAVYLGSGAFNARQGAKNFTLDELPDAVRYCHVRGVAVHLTLNTLVTDRELEQAGQTIAAAVRSGVDASSCRIWASCLCCGRWPPRSRSTPPPR